MSRAINFDRWVKLLLQKSTHESAMSERTVAILAHALTLVEHSSSLNDAIRRLQSALHAAETRPVESTAGPGRLRGRSFFDRLMEAILERVKQAVSREELITYTLAGLTEDSRACAGLCYLCIEAELTREERIAELRVVASALIQKHRLTNFATELLPRTVHSAMLQDVLVGRETLEFLLTEYLPARGYNHDFAGLAAPDKSPLWLCALPLPAAEATQPARMLVALYPVVGPPDAPSLPRGATQEWRVLSFFRVAYEMLNHQLASTREMVLRQRRELLADLAPGIVNHEIYQQVNGFSEAIKLMKLSVHRLHPLIPESNPDFETLSDGLLTVTDAANRLRVIADAFNNLERRPDSAAVLVDQLLDEVFTLQNYAFSKHGIDLQRETCVPAQIHADAALLEHVLLNVVANAVEAIAEETTKPTAPIIRVRVLEEPAKLSFLIMNNGAQIGLTRPERIFEKGFTTKPRGIGHGLGLHMCRLVMTYIGGTIDLMERSHLDADMTVGFQITLPHTALTTGDIFGR